MALPVPSFFNLPAGNEPASLLDQQFAAIAATGVISCAATGMNVLVLTPNPNNFVPTAYTTGAPKFAWIQPSTTVASPVTINVAGLGGITAYKRNGIAPLGAGDLVAGCLYTAAFDASLSSGSGGMVVDSIAGNAVVSDNPPSSPGAGDLWWDPIGGLLYVYYQDATSAQWVNANSYGIGTPGSGDLNFPNTPTVGQQFQSPNGTFQWDGVKWIAVPGIVSFDGRTGAVTLQTADVNTAFAVPGVPARAPTPAPPENSTIIATTAFVAAAVAGVIGGGGGYNILGIVNIKDFGAKGDGVTDDSAAFLAFNTWASAQTQSVSLVIPPGTYAGLKISTAGSARQGGDFYRGIKDLTVYAYGASLANMGRLSPFEIVQVIPLTVSARLNAVPLNSTTATLVNVGDAANFAIGNWVAVSSLEMQKTGFPPNWFYLDYAKITNISGTTITFERPLKFSHKSTYPQTVQPSEVPTIGWDAGGPATMFLLLQDWDQRVKIMGAKFLGSDGKGTYICARNFELVDCDFSANSQGAVPTQCMDVMFQRCNMGSTFLPDKDITLMRMDNCDIPQLHLTSASTDKFWIDGCRISTIDVGLMKNTIIRNSNIGTFNLQAPGFGATGSLILENCEIAATGFTAASGYMALSTLTFSNGTFSIPKAAPTANLIRFFAYAIPGAKGFFTPTAGGGVATNAGTPFVITAVYEDATNFYFDTTLTAIPTLSGTLGAAAWLTQHPCPRLTGFNITGDDTAIQFGKGTPGLPVYSYARKLYAQDLAGAWQTPPSTTAIRQWGTLVSLKINVLRADTGAVTPLKMGPIGKFGAVNYPASGVMGNWNPQVDLKTAGLRTITPSTVTGSVGADVLGAAPGAIWFGDKGLNPWLTASIAANTPAQYPIVDIELITDQGVTALEYNAL